MTTTPTTTTTAPPVTFLDPQPTPGDGDRVWFAPARSSTDLYAVTRDACSCPAGTYHPDRLCAHRAVLLLLLDEDPPDLDDHWTPYASQDDGY